ncbi:unnamed protein product [Mycena citricolor]|uniref:Uncharacterized protein n=1 Tax=Mycena citricolor TaxID=2018698 RepID=A0AAD2K792_9AGAR|nr:unnamed protein product [Mycena citricolor]CAK5283044.1 unnamed protein product [Mycena citricolor]
MFPHPQVSPVSVTTDTSSNGMAYWYLEPRDLPIGNGIDPNQASNLSSFAIQNGCGFVSSSGNPGTFD